MSFVELLPCLSLSAQPSAVSSTAFLYTRSPSYFGEAGNTRLSAFGQAHGAGSSLAGGVAAAAATAATADRGIHEPLPVLLLSV